MKKKLIAFLALFLSISFAQAQHDHAAMMKQSESMDHSKHNHEDHTPAPIGIMADHHHQKGGWMFSYQYMNMRMKGLLDQGNFVSGESVKQSYMMSPETMTMDMHMFDLMYAISNKITLMGMVMYYQNDMSMINRMGDKLKMKSSGMGDLSLSGIFYLLNKQKNSIHFNLGLTVPTGSIQEKNDMGLTLPYPMQIGSGTFDPFIGFTYLKKSKNVTLGFQTVGKTRLGTNDSNYKLGNEILSNLWLSGKLSPLISISGRFKYHFKSKIIGQDETINPMMSPLGNPLNSGGHQFNFLPGINVNLPINGLGLGIETGIPLIQKVNGIQMKETFSYIIGLQFSI